MEVSGIAFADQKRRADILFYLYPDIHAAYLLSQQLNWIFETTKEKIYGYTRLAQWHEKFAQSGFKSFNTISRTIMNHYKTILNYFDNRSTNASAESDNATIKAFRSHFRGVRNIEFFLFRLTQIYGKPPGFGLDPVLVLILPLILPLSKLRVDWKRKKHHPLDSAFIRVIRLGFEPRTHTLKVYCSTS